MARHIKVSGRVWRAIGTLAHNRSFTAQELSEYAGVDGAAWVKRLRDDALITRTGRGHYFPTTAGWNRIEGIFSDRRRSKLGVSGRRRNSRGRFTRAR